MSTSPKYILCTIESISDFDHPKEKAILIPEELAILGNKVRIKIGSRNEVWEITHRFLKSHKNENKIVMHQLGITNDRK